MLLVQLSIILTLLSRQTSSINCRDSYSCARHALNATHAGNYIRCGGYKSCFESPSVINLVGGDIDCQGSYSCSNSALIEAGNYDYLSNIACVGLMSCANVTNISLLYGGNVDCIGEQSCINSKMRTLTSDNINLSNKVNCFAHLSCANSDIIITSPNTEIDIAGYLAAYNTRFTSFSDTSYIFNGYLGGFGATVSCNGNVVCNIQCFVNSCNNLTLLGDGAFNINCDTAEKSVWCPTGYDGSKYNNDYTYTLKVTDIVKHNLIRLQTNEATALKCDDSYQCLNYTNIKNIVYDNMNISYYNTNNEYGYVATSTSIHCRGFQSCFFTNIVFELDYSNNNITDNCLDNIDTCTKTLLRCDGAQSCLNISQFVAIEYNINDHHTHIDDIQFDVYVGGGHPKRGYYYDTPGWSLDNHNYNYSSYNFQNNVYCSAYFGCS